MELSCAHQTMGFLPGCNPYRKGLGLNWKVQVLADGRLALGSLLPVLHSLQKTALLFSVCICSGEAQRTVHGHQMNTCEKHPQVD